MKRKSRLLAVLLGLLILSLAGPVAARNCAEVYGGVADQNTLIQNIATCQQEARDVIHAAVHAGFTARLNYGTCEISISGNNFSYGPVAFPFPTWKRCMEQYGWTNLPDVK
jgi:hypothetical protein